LFHCAGWKKRRKKKNIFLYVHVSVDKKNLEKTQSKADDKIEKLEKTQTKTEDKIDKLNDLSVENSGKLGELSTINNRITSLEGRIDHAMLASTGQGHQNI